jgi:trehalose 6-phosphate synthase/phosphatase
MSEGRLLVVSNRLPLTLRKADVGWESQPSSGGLATALDPLLKQHGGTWIGWAGESEPVDAEERQRLLDERAPGYSYLPLDVDAEFYEGYPNQTVWPLFHFFPSEMRFDPGSWAAYVEGNRRFCDVVVEAARPGNLIWIHDYHLMLLPAMVRDRLPDARIGFFLHIPFPSSEVFSMLPRRDEVLSGLIGADLIAFHTHGHVHHFRQSLLRVLGLNSSVNVLPYGGRSVGLEAMPIGIAAREWIASVAENGETEAHYADLKQRYAGQHVVLSVDRLDYTKGIPQRLRTFRRMIEGNAELVGKIVLIQVLVPTREGIDKYQTLRDEVNQLVGEINGKLGTTDWTPVVHIHRSITRTELAALYRMADVAWVTPLRDGMNLVAKEYCACKPEGDGALVLSEFAGAAAEMGEAFLVNPYDEERVAETVLRVIQLEPEERRLRMRALHKRVIRNDVFQWAKGFVARLESVPAPAEGNIPSQPLEPRELARRYRRAHSRVIALDYDGTLVPFAPRPDQATPNRAVLNLITRLCADRGNTVAIVSGRRSEDLEKWFGGIEGLVMGAEHGAKLRESGGQEWRLLRDGPYSSEWKEQVRPILEHYVDRTPGSFIEEKDLSLAWHYRMAEPEFAEWLAGELVALLEGMLSAFEVAPVHGQKVVEIRPVWANKGEFIDWLLRERTPADFYFAAGDDLTDEDMFAKMPTDSVVVHVGPNVPRAAFRVNGPAQFVTILQEAFTLAE